MKEADKDKIELINTAWVYTLLTTAGGMFYRKFTKFNGFVGRTTPSVVHAHLFLLGMIFFLAAAPFQFQVDAAGQKCFHLFYLIYDIGVAITVIMLIWHGVTQVQGVEFSRALDASIFGIARVGHIYTGIGVIPCFTMLKVATRNQK